MTSASEYFSSNDAFVWTKNDPDLELVEPPILASLNFNYLQFSRSINRPPEKRIIRIINHGDYPITFKVQTTDNYSYFCDQVQGVIPGRRMIASAQARASNMITINVFHRPYSCYPDEEQCKYHNIPRKDKLFVLLTPTISTTFSALATFHAQKPYEKLRVLLHYTGTACKEDGNKTKQLLLRSANGWCTWENSLVRSKKSVPK